MGYKIKRYYKKKTIAGWTVWAEVYKTNIWGAIKNIYNYQLDNNMFITQVEAEYQYYSTRTRNSTWQRPMKKKMAERFVEILNARL